VQFFKDLIWLIDQIGAGAVGIKTISDLLKLKYPAVVAALDYILRSTFTAEIEAQDRVRDGTYRGLVLAIESYLHHPDDAKRDAATKLHVLVEHYGNIARQGYNDESAAIDDILREFAMEKNAAFITTLGLGAWVAELAAANARFSDLMHDRYNEETAQRPAIPMRVARVAVDEQFHALITRVEAIVALNGIDFTPELSAFVTEYNILAGKYKKILALERGRRAAAKGEGDEDEGIDEGIDEGNGTEETE
jgi:hypothetical protein